MATMVNTFDLDLQTKTSTDNDTSQPDDLSPTTLASNLAPYFNENTKITDGITSYYLSPQNTQLEMEQADNQPLEGDTSSPVPEQSHDLTDETDDEKSISSTDAAEIPAINTQTVASSSYTLPPTMAMHKPLPPTMAIPEPRKVVNRRLYVSGFPRSMSAEAFQSFFEAYGEVTYVEIDNSQSHNPNESCGFITFHSLEASARVLTDIDTILMEGNKVHICEATPKKTQLFVGGLHPDVDSEMMRDHFNTLGEVCDAIVKMDSRTGTSRCFGFVTFLDCDHVVNQLCDLRFIDCFGKKIEVKRATPISQYFRGLKDDRQDNRSDNTSNNNNRRRHNNRYNDHQNNWDSNDRHNNNNNNRGRYNDQKNNNNRGHYQNNSSNNRNFNHGNDSDESYRRRFNQTNRENNNQYDHHQNRSRYQQDENQHQNDNNSSQQQYQDINQHNNNNTEADNASNHNNANNHNNNNANQYGHFMYTPQAMPQNPYQFHSQQQQQQYFHAQMQQMQQMQLQMQQLTAQALENPNGLNNAQALNNMYASALSTPAIDLMNYQFQMAAAASLDNGANTTAAANTMYSAGMEQKQDSVEDLGNTMFAPTAYVDGNYFQTMGKNTMYNFNSLKPAPINTDSALSCEAVNQEEAVISPFLYT